ncbi:MAG: phage/plasmid primase, P4 family, partial [Pirellulales bacterium]
VPGIWADVDFRDKDQGGKKSVKIYPTEDQAAEAIKALGVAPTISVNSGGGVHLYWLFDEPFVIDDEADRERIAGVVKGFQDRLRTILLKQCAALLDSTHDLARVLRIPGTIHTRVPDHVVNVGICNEFRYPVSKFEVDELPQSATKSRGKAQAAPKQPKKPKTAGTSDLPATLANFDSEPPGSKLYDLCEANRKFKHVFDNNASFESPSESDMSLANSAIGEGWSPEETAALLVSFSRKHYPARVDKVLRVSGGIQDYLHRTIAKAFDYQRHSIGNQSHHTRASFGEALANVVTHSEGRRIQWFARDDSGNLYRYADGRYVRGAERWIKAQVKKAVQRGLQRRRWTKSSAENVVEWIRSDAPDIVPPKSKFLNVQNGLLRLSDRHLLPHDTGYLTSIQIPARYDPQAACPTIDRCIREWFPKDAMDIAYELIGYLAVPDLSIQQAVLLLGTGGNGKSRYLEMVRQFIGPANVTAVSLHKLEANRFASARLAGKLVNICPDLPSGHLTETSVFKAITGGDRIEGEQKFKDAFEFSPFCRLVFAANKIPRSSDFSVGYFDRWKVIPFTNRFRGRANEIPKEQLDKKLASPTEQSGLLNAALDGLDRIRKRGMRFHTSKSLETVNMEFRSIADYLFDWLETKTIREPDSVTPCDDLRREFRQHCLADGRSSMTDKEFGTRLKALRPEAVRMQRMIDGHVRWCYLEIGLRKSAPGFTGSTDISDLGQS